MSNAWHSVYLKESDPSAAAAALIEALTVHGYAPYDPFPGGSGTPPRFKTFIKQFALPLTEGWTRICGEPDGDALLTLSTQLSIPILRAWLDDGQGSGDWQVIANGTMSSDAEAFAPYLKATKTANDLRRAQAGNVPLAEIAPTSALPPDVQQLARDRNVNPKQADRMMERMTAQLFGKLDRSTGGEANAMQDQARALISGSTLDWNGEAGRRVRAVADMLAIPANWRTPDWTDIRDAYQAARMLARNPKASLLPGERDALKAIPNAGQYKAVYVGK